MRTDTLRRALIVLLAVDWVIAFVLTFGMVISWVLDPPHAPQTAWQLFYGAIFMFALFSYGAGAFLFVFAGLPWAVLHLLGARSFRFAPVAGFVVAFWLGFDHTYSVGHQDPRLDTSMWEPDGRSSCAASSPRTAKRSTAPARPYGRGWSSACSAACSAPFSGGPSTRVRGGEVDYPIVAWTRHHRPRHDRRDGGANANDPGHGHTVGAVGRGARAGRLVRKSRLPTQRHLLSAPAIASRRRR